MMGPMMAFMVLLCGALIALVVAAIAVIIRILGRRPDARRADRNSALETLRERYARGEINEAEYRECRRVLGVE
ncbi:MAG TPA: SHOCT domain-containing protein [Nitrolancea sp.]|nr:SHOCT domain-containing protein [Nitrolancea sp.]